MNMFDDDGAIPAKWKAGDHEPVFNEPWEAEAFGLVVHMHQNGLFTWAEWADQLSSSISELADDTPYYEAWLHALEKITLKKTRVDTREVVERMGEWRLALEHTPHGQPIELGDQHAD